MVYLLFEHKSYADRLTVFQLLRYVVRINERRLREGLPLCCVVPLVVYHGLTGWNVARSIDELIDVPLPLARFLPQFSMELFDLSSYGDEELRGEAFVHATLLLLKYILRPELPDELTRIFELMSAMEHQAHGLDCIKLLVAYVIQGSDRVDAEVLRGALRAGLPQRGDELMPTLAEQWVRQGKEEGLQEGRQEGLQEGRQEGLQEGRQEGLQEGLHEGRQEGLQEGRQEGTFIGVIQTCRTILGEATELSDLSGKSLDELRELAERLQTQVQERLPRG